MVAQSESARPGAVRATALCTSPHGARLHTAGGRGRAVSSVAGPLGARLVRGERGGAAAACGAFWRRGPAARAKPALARQAVARCASPGRPTAAACAPGDRVHGHQRQLRTKCACCTHVKKRLQRGQTLAAGTHAGARTRAAVSTQKTRRRPSGFLFHWKSVMTPVFLEKALWDLPEMIWRSGRH